MNYINAYELLNWASARGLKRQIPIDLAVLCNLLDIGITYVQAKEMGFIKKIESRKTIIALDSSLATDTARFVTAMLIGHYWQQSNIAKGNLEEIELTFYQVNDIAYPNLTFAHDLEVFTYSLFASQLLMPSKAVKSRWQLTPDNSHSTNKLIELAKTFQVPVNVMRQRVADLNCHRNHSLIDRTIELSRKIFFTKLLHRL